MKRLIDHLFTTGFCIFTWAMFILALLSIKP